MKDEKGKFRYIDDLTSDVMFEAYGKTPEELFVNAALALSNVICQAGKVKRKKSIDVEVRGNSHEELMFNWLQEIIAQVDLEGMFFSGFQVMAMGKDFIKGRFSGEDADPSKGETVVKAVTKYGFKMWKDEDMHKVRVVVDV